MAKVGADVIIAHMNTTIGGTIGAETAFTLEDAAVRVQEICDAAKAQNPDVICLSQRWSHRKGTGCSIYQ